MGYCTTTDFYDYGDLNTTAVSSTLVQTFIDAAFSNINRFSGTFFATTASECTSVTETLDPTPLVTDVSESYLVLGNYPVQQLESVSINNSSYATTNFLVYDDRIKISTSASSISSFGTNNQNVVVTYKYGVVDSASVDIAKQLNIYLALLDFVTSPKGRNIYLDNSRYSEINQNNVRPDDVVSTFISDLKEKIEELRNTLGVAHTFF